MIFFSFWKKKFQWSIHKSLPANFIMILVMHNLSQNKQFEKEVSRILVIAIDIIISFIPSLTLPPPQKKLKSTLVIALLIFFKWK